jgi:hypothetical protein
LHNVTLNVRQPFVTSQAETLLTQCQPLPIQSPYSNDDLKKANPALVTEGAQGMPFSNYLQSDQDLLKPP